MYKFNFQSVGSLFFLNVLFLISCTPQYENQIKKLEESHNNHLINEVSSLYTDDAKFVLVGSWVAEGKEKLIERFNWDFAVNGSLKFFDYTTINDTVVCKVEERNEFFKKLNIDVVKYDYAKFIFEKSLIKETRAKLNQSSKEMIEKSFSSFVQWAIREKPLELETLKTDGKFSFIRENSTKWLELLQNYKDVFPIE